MDYNIIDSLPYVENDLNDIETKNYVNKLIIEEMLKIKNEKSFNIENYLKDYPKINYFQKCSENIKEEIKRVEVLINQTKERRKA
jgi:hypothetical protein